MTRLSRRCVFGELSGLRDWSETFLIATCRGECALDLASHLRISLRVFLSTGFDVPQEITHAFPSLGILPDRIICIQDALNHRSLTGFLLRTPGRIRTCYHSNWRRA